LEYGGVGVDFGDGFGDHGVVVVLDLFEVLPVVEGDGFVDDVGAAPAFGAAVDVGFAVAVGVEEGDEFGGVVDLGEGGDAVFGGGGGVDDDAFESAGG